MPLPFDEINPPPRLLMGPGPINADPRVHRAMSAALLGQFDPAFTEYMNEAMALYREVFETKNKWTFLIDTTSRGAIEAVLCSLIEKGDRVLVPSFGRFGLLLEEISSRLGAEVKVLHREWGTVFPPEEIEEAVKAFQPKIVAICQGDTSTTMNQPLEEVGKIAKAHGAVTYVDATASIAGNRLAVDEWELDSVTAGLQKCIGGPSGSGPITLNDKVAAMIKDRWHVEKGIQPAGFTPGTRSRITSNYLDLAQIMAYWSEQRLNHHTEATTMLYGARECARILYKEGLLNGIARHKLGSDAMVAGLQAMGLKLFGDLAHKMNNVTGVYIPAEVNGDAVRADMLNRFGIEIGTSFGPLHGKIWRIGNMGYNCREPFILQTLGALQSVLLRHGAKLSAADPVDAAMDVYDR